MPGMPALPAGTVTLLFSDIEGSTALLARLGDRYVEALDVHRSLLRASWEQWGGVEMGTEGDSFFVVFDIASHAVSAALQAQRGLATSTWPDGARLTVRIGVHTGEPAIHEGGYVGMDVHLAARIAAAAHGGQVVMSQATVLLVSGRLDDEVDLVDLGRHRLKDITEPEHIYQLSAPGLQTVFPALKSLGTATSLPVSTTPLVGRERELRELFSLALSADVRLVTLTGPGGSGKTRLAAAAATQLVESYPDGVYFVALASVNSVEAMWSTVAEVLGASGEDRARSRFLDWLRSRRALVVLDNLEQLPGAAAVVGELLEAAHHVDVIATSRSPLHLHGEREFPVPVLGLPAVDDLEHSQQSEAVQLFRQHAQLVRPGFTLTASNAAEVVALCRRLDGMPLAIELAAARLKLLSPAALLARLDSTTDLTGRAVDRPARQQTLRAAIGWSYELLPADLQGFFRRLGVFAGGADLDAVAAVTPEFPDAFDAVTELVDASLVTVVDGPDGEPRISLLQTIRDFTLELLEQCGELDATRSLHAAHYLAVTETLSERLDGDQLIADRDRMDLEQDNMREVLSWALDRAGSSTTEPASHRLSVGLRMCDLLYAYWRNGHRAEARQWYERALVLAGSDESDEVATHLLMLGGLQLIQGEEPASIETLTRALTMFRRLENEAGIVSALRILGEAHTSLGAFDTGRELLQESLSRARRDGDDRRAAIALVDSGWLEHLAGNTDTAAAHLLDARRLFLSLDHTAWTATVELMLAAVSLAQGDIAAAARGLDDLASHRVLLRDSEDACILVEQYALLAAAGGNALLAARLLGAAEQLRRKNEEPRSAADQAHLDRHLAAARAALGVPEWEQARLDGAGLSLEQALAEAQVARGASS